MKAIGSKASELAKLFIVKEFERDGKKFTRTIIDHDYKEKESELHKACVDLTFKVSQETNLDSDSVYDFTAAVLEAISGCNDEDEARDKLYEIEPAIYTAELTEWLGKSNNNVYYLDQAISEYEAKDGFSALSLAQHLAIQEVGNIIISELAE